MIFAQEPARESKAGEQMQCCALEATPACSMCLHPLPPAAVSLLCPGMLLYVGQSSSEAHKH